MITRFENRQEAGRRLAERLDESIGARQEGDVVVLALPRGGVPVGAEVASALGATLDIVVARKIGAPGQPEVGIGAIAGEDPPVFDPRSLQMLGLIESDLAPAVARERAELHRRDRLYRRGRPEPRLEGKTVVLVDDGVATGVTARVALRHLRAEHPARLILAVPVCAPESTADLRSEADDLICLQQPPHFRAVGLWYDDFDQVSDQEVIDLLEAQRALH